MVKAITGLSQLTGKTFETLASQPKAPKYDPAASKLATDRANFKAAQERTQSSFDFKMDNDPWGFRSANQLGGPTPQLQLKSGPGFYQPMSKLQMPNASYFSSNSNTYEPQLIDLGSSYFSSSF
jgi:hypothetical protein